MRISLQARIILILLLLFGVQTFWNMEHVEEPSLTALQENETRLKMHSASGCRSTQRVAKRIADPEGGF